MKRDIGIIVFPEFFQTEGVDGALDNIQRRANPAAIATSPYVMRPSDQAHGGREPPIDGGLGTVRLLDRPLWGRRELFVQTSVAYEPDTRFYDGLRYQPPKPDEHTAREGALVAAAVDNAHKRGLKVHMQVQAAIPPGYRVQFGGPVADDEPTKFDGQRAGDRLDKNGSLASPHIVAYTCALLKDLAAAYPEIDGFHIDWPEYPPYTLDSAFFDFSAHARDSAKAFGFDFDRMRLDTGRFYDWLTREMTRAELSGLASAEDVQPALAEVLARYPGVMDAIRMRRRLVSNLIAAVRDAVPGKGVLLRSFPPPWTAISGFDFAAAGVDAISVKLFTMHWPMMVGSWTRRLLKDNPNLGTLEDIAPLVAALFDLCDDPTHYGAAIAQYPESDSPHPVDRAAQMRKIAAARQAAGKTPIYSLAHGYGPVSDFGERLRAAFDAADGRVWINRYGYLADAKLDLIGAID
ncbi:MAG: hypothetical protein JNN22_11830 [Rhodospirillales bacterium]|nr:hypothetical protein [Rhodospirillales bacterium]